MVIKRINIQYDLIKGNCTFTPFYPDMITIMTESELKNSENYSAFLRIQKDLERLITSKYFYREINRQLQAEIEKDIIRVFYEYGYDVCEQCSEANYIYITFKYVVTPSKFNYTVTLSKKENKENQKMGFLDVLPKERHDVFRIEVKINDNSQPRSEIRVSATDMNGFKICPEHLNADCKDYIHGHIRKSGKITIQILDKLAELYLTKVYNHTFVIINKSEVTNDGKQGFVEFSLVKWKYGRSW